MRRILAESVVIGAGTLFWIALTALFGLPTRDGPIEAESAVEVIPPWSQAVTGGDDSARVWIETPWTRDGRDGL